MNKFPKICLAALFLLSIPIASEPWLNLDSYYDVNILNKKIRECDGSHLIPSHTFPLSFGNLISILDLNIEESSNNQCKSFYKETKKSIEDNYNSRSLKIGIQSAVDDMFFQSLGTRYYSNDNVSLDFSNVSSNFAFKIKALRDLKKNEYSFDESYISYKHKNTVYSLGRVSRWWSPSSQSSLILSNSARPSFGIEVKNYLPINPEKKFISYLGTINYEIFLTRLEKDRSIPNALLFGNKISFRPSKNFNFSIMRLAQFGGDNRPTDIDTILKMIVGIDNASEKLSREDQPGNQIAGFDFIYYYKDLSFYGQLIGEDEAGFFPSRKLKLIGSSWINYNSSIPFEASIDYIDTYSGIENYSYNHGLYKDGLRYYKIPIGASIDADSDSSSVTFKTVYDDINFKINISRVNLNKNNSQKNFWSLSSVDFIQSHFNITKKFKNINIDLNYIYKNTSNSDIKKNNFFINLTYNF